MSFKEISITEKERQNRQLLRAIYRAEWLAISIIALLSLGLLAQALSH